MPEAAPRRSLAARRRTTIALALDDNDPIDEKENSFNESLNGRRQSRLLNSSFNGIDEPAQTPRQLVDLYQKTVELATQGKINVKNAFSIPLVERLPQILNAIALDDKENHHLGPNFVKAGSVIDTSAKIYGYRVDALHSETQKLCGNILDTEEGTADDGVMKREAEMEENSDNIDGDRTQSKKPVRRVKPKATSFLVTDPSKITLEHEFEFRPLQPPNICQWRGGIGADSIYAEMVSSTMYSSSDYPLIDGFTNANSKPEDNYEQLETILAQTQAKSIDLIHLREVIKSKEGHDHPLGNQTLRDFTFTETPSGSFIDTLHESCLGSMDESMQRAENNADDFEHDDHGYNHEELVHAAIEDLNDDPSHANEVFKHALSELSSQDPSSLHSHLGNYQSQQSANSHLLSTDGLLSASFASNMSFADQMPNLLNSKDVQSDYSYFDATKLKLFAGPNIWKFTNLLNATPADASTVQQKQAPTTPHKISSVAREAGGAKRGIRMDVFQSTSIDQIMSSNAGGNRERKAASTSQSSLLLRVREKNLNQMQLARKVRALTDLTNFHNFPDLNADYLESINRRRAESQERTDPFFSQEDADGPNFHHHDDENDPAVLVDYDFIRPVHYEKIEFAKGSSSVNAKILKRQMIEEFTRQKHEQQRTLSSLDVSTSSQQSSSISSQSPSIIEFSIVLENLADHGHLSLQTDVASAFYCMLINCNENKLFMRNNAKRDDLIIQEQPFNDQRDLSTLSYSYVSHSNLSVVN